MPGKKSGLGKGLDSLIPNKKNDISDSNYPLHFQQPAKINLFLHHT